MSLLYPLPKFLRSHRVSALPVLLCFLNAPGILAQLTPSPSPPISQTPGVSASPIPLDGWLTSSSLWQTTPVQFPEARSLGFRWVSTARDVARASSRGLRLGDLSVAEVIVRFSS